MQMAKKGESMKIFQKEEYVYYLKEVNEDGSEWWRVENTKTFRSVNCSSLLASEKIVSLAISIRDRKPKLINHVTLEKKAGWLQKKTY